MTESTRPKHVVIVDAENPMEEICGEIFWREDHERLVAHAAELAFRDGYTRGWDAHAAQALSAPIRMTVRPRRRHHLFRALLVLVGVAYLVSLITALVR